MIDSSFFWGLIESKKMDFITGVPDSLLKEFLKFVNIRVDDNKHIVAANEGNAIALAAGKYLATGNPSVVYMQNSGLGNTMNPLISLADPTVYNIPMLLLIGWRGKPGIKDEPQHVKQGEITLALLDLLNIKYYIITENSTEEEIRILFDNIYDNLINNKICAFVFEKNSFSKTDISEKNIKEFNMTREEAVKKIVEIVNDEDIIVSTTGKLSRELNECRKIKTKFENFNFLNVGAMGHTSQIALGIAMNTNKSVYCIEGDGSLIMHMGGIVTVGSSNLSNYRHIIIDNKTHDSVGGQPTNSSSINIPLLFESCGYKYVDSCKKNLNLEDKILKLTDCNGPGVLIIAVEKGARKNLSRPSRTPIENKKKFMNSIR